MTTPRDTPSTNPTATRREPAYTLPLPGGREARVYLTHGPLLTHAHGLAFGPDAERLASLPSRGFNGYCHAEIVALTLAPLSDAGIVTADDIAASVADIFGEACACDDDDADDADDDAGGVIESPRWPDGCPLTLRELAHVGNGHIDCQANGETAPEVTR